MRQKELPLMRTFANTLMLLIGLVLLLATAQAQTYSVLHSFTGGGDGGDPSTLSMDQAGNLDGTAFTGGVGYGVAFKLKQVNSNWIITPLYSFAGGSDGAGPAGIAVAPNGLLYGTTQAGGDAGCGIPIVYTGCGTVYSLSPGAARPRSVISPWEESVVYRFTGSTDGLAPYGLAPLIFDQSGDLYGTAFLGGKYGSCNVLGTYACGAVFKLALSGDHWAESVLWSFGQQQDDGVEPASGVIFDPAGNLYGTTITGGTGSGCDVQGHGGCGTVYELTPSEGGWRESVLYSFRGGSDGGAPYAGVIRDSLGNLYGATAYGGSGGGGTIFKLSPFNGGWTFTLLYSFAGAGSGPNMQCPNCPGPFSSLTMDNVGNLYGTTYNDGAHGHGSVFKLVPSGGSWIYTDLHDFTGGSDGGNIWVGVFLDASGNLYGTASAGGNPSACGGAGCGVIFKIAPN